MDALTPDQIRKYREDGYLVLPSGLSPENLEIIAADTLALLGEEEERRSGDAAYVDLTLYRRWRLGLHVRSLKIREYVASSVFKTIGRSLIGNEVDLYYTSTITKSPGRNKSIDWHQDAAYEKDGHSPRLICWTSVTPSHPDNGGLAIIPGSHRNGLIPHGKSDLYHRDLQTVGVDPEQALHLSMDAGEILVIHPYLVHGSGENKTSGHRIALLSAYQKPKAEHSEYEAQIRMVLLREA